MTATALQQCLSGRLPETPHVGIALVAVALPGTYSMIGNIIPVDGGESHIG